MSFILQKDSHAVGALSAGDVRPRYQVQPVARPTNVQDIRDLMPPSIAGKLVSPVLRDGTKLCARFGSQNGCSVANCPFALLGSQSGVLGLRPVPKPTPKRRPRSSASTDPMLAAEVFLKVRADSLAGHLAGFLPGLFARGAARSDLAVQVRLKKHKAR